MPVASILRGGVGTSRIGTTFSINDTPCMEFPTTQGHCRTCRLTEIGATVNDREDFCKREGREPVGGLGACTP